LESGITSLQGKEHELAEEAKQFSLDIAGISSTNCRSFNSLDLHDGGHSSSPAVTQQCLHKLETEVGSGPALAGARPNARPRRGATLSSVF